MASQAARWQGLGLAGAVVLAVRQPAGAFLSGTTSAMGSLRRGVVAAHNAPARGKPLTATQLSAPLVGALALALAGGTARVARPSQKKATALRVTTRTEWYRKVKRIGGDQAVFDVTVPKPMGLKLQKFPQKRGVGISQVFPDGNADKLNRRVCIDDEPGSGMWVLEGDQLMAINGTDCEDADIEDIIQLVGDSDGDDIKLTLMRNTRKGPIKVVVMPEGFSMTVRRGARLSSAAEAAKGRELKYGCIDGWCGTCWHRERTTNGIFKPCCDVLTGDWDNVMPLVITPKPEKAGDSTFLNPRGV